MLPNRHTVQTSSDYDANGNKVYRYGFNGMESDFEVNNVTKSSYTASFWQYDSRLGRRWNVDPAVKPWRSSYDAFSNNPIIMVDPNGDDDYFNSKGGFLGSDNLKTNTIWIVTDRTIPINFYKDYHKKIVNNNVGQKNAYNLSGLNYSFSDNRKVLKNVSKFYAKSLKIKALVDVGEHEKGTVIAYASGANNIYINVTGGLSPLMDDAGNFKSVLKHEENHNKIKDPETHLDHVAVYINQIEDENIYKNTTKDYKQHITRNIAKYLNEAYEAGENTEYIEGTIKYVNDNHSKKLGGTYSSGYSFDENKTVVTFQKNKKK